MKAYTISTKSSLGAIEKRENKISSHFQLNKKPVIFEAIWVGEDILREKSCQTYFLKNRSVVIFPGTLWLTYEKKYLHEDFQENSK